MNLLQAYKRFEEKFVYNGVGAGNDTKVLWSRRGPRAALGFVGATVGLTVGSALGTPLLGVGLAVMGAGVGGLILPYAFNGKKRAGVGDRTLHFSHQELKDQKRLAILKQRAFTNGMGKFLTSESNMDFHLRCLINGTYEIDSEEYKCVKKTIIEHTVGNIIFKDHIDLVMGANALLDKNEKEKLRRSKIQKIVEEKTKKEEPKEEKVKEEKLKKEEVNNMSPTFFNSPKKANIAEQSNSNAAAAA